jgi:hypothetical protein
MAAGRVLIRAAFLTAAGLAAAPAAQARWNGPPLALPETIRGEIASDRPKPVPAVVDKLAEVGPAIAACWQPPAGLTGFPDIEVTARFSLRRDGMLIGIPRITFATSDVAVRARELLTRAALEAIAACTPLRLSPELGAAIAGRPFAIRFIYRGPPGRGA